MCSLTHLTVILGTYCTQCSKYAARTSSAEDNVLPVGILPNLIDLWYFLDFLNNSNLCFPGLCTIKISHRFTWSTILFASCHMHTVYPVLNQSCQATNIMSFQKPNVYTHGTYNISLCSLFVIPRASYFSCVRVWIRMEEVCYKNFWFLNTTLQLSIILYDNYPSSTLLLYTALWKVYVFL